MTDLFWSLWLLHFHLVLVYSHSLFVLVSKQNNNTVYTHRLLLNRRVQIPCFKEGDALIDSSTTFHWSHRGFNITQIGDSPFISADWDVHGNLMIQGLLPRQINLWCHFNALLFIHRLEFSESAFTQTVFAVDMSAKMDANLSKSYQEFIYSQKTNCRVQLAGGGLGVLKGAPGIDLSKDVFQKTVVMELVAEACEKRLDCSGYSMDYFECSVSMEDKTALYSIDFSIMHSMDVWIPETSAESRGLAGIDNVSQ